MGELSDIRVIRDIEAKNNCKHHKRALSLAIALDRLRLGKTNLSKLNLLLISACTIFATQKQAWTFRRSPTYEGCEESPGNTEHHIS